LREDDSLPEHARKLLSFTDNRQDASLQAGHFNDFVQVTMLRSALWRAVADGGDAGLTHDEVPQRVFDALDLPFGVYARDTDLKGHARLDTDRVFREVPAYRRYGGLQRGWRRRRPSVEQVGRLRIEDKSLPAPAAVAEEWGSCHPALADADPEVRESVLRTLLALIRRDLAIKVGVPGPP